MSHDQFEVLSNQAVAVCAVAYFLALLSHLVEWAAARSVPAQARRGGADAESAQLNADGGVAVLERTHTVLPVCGVSVGIAGVKGFVGGFGNTWANFGEPLFRAAYAETTGDVEGLERSLQAIEACAVRIALLHYAPCEDTLVGEPERIWLVLGADRLAGPIREHRPQLVVHGHAHHGSFEGDVDGVPVYNVAVHVMGRDFWVFELDAEDRASHEPVSVQEAG